MKIVWVELVTLSPSAGVDHIWVTSASSICKVSPRYQTWIEACVDPTDVS